MFSIFLNKTGIPVSFSMIIMGHHRGGHAHVKSSRGLIDSNLWKNVTNSAEGLLADLLSPCKTILLRNCSHS